MKIIDIEKANERIDPYVRRTPLERSEALSQLLGTNVYVKYELFQKTGSFKARGAFNKLLSLSEEERAKGVVAVSGGNHAQAVAYASKILGSDAVILMPESTPKNYVDATLDYGATVDLQPTIAEAFDEIERYKSEGRVFVHPFDDDLVMAGQGTLGLEILEDCPQVTDVILSIGGGGLMGGVATALKASGRGSGANERAEMQKPARSKGETIQSDRDSGANKRVSNTIRIWGVETVGADAMTQALASDKPVQLDAITSIAKTLGAPAVSDATLALCKKYLESVTVVTDAEAVAALHFIAERLKVITEPAASCTLAAAEKLKANFNADSHLVLILCGGNVSLNDVCSY
ncbi:MAG: threonine ammonia-lyase [Pyrinomonadaceae bacterium]